MKVSHHFSRGVSKVLCAVDCSAILTDGDVYVCGRNSSNRFGFGRIVESVDNLKKVSCIKNRVVDFSISSHHSAFVVDGGYVMTIGDNKEGQLGLGHSKDVKKNPSFIKKLSTKYIRVR